MNTREFDYKGHHYKVVPIENDDQHFIIIRDGVKSRRVSKELAEEPMRFIDRLFK